MIAPVLGIVVDLVVLVGVVVCFGLHARNELRRRRLLQRCEARLDQADREARERERFEHTARFLESAAHRPRTPTDRPS